MDAAKPGGYGKPEDPPKAVEPLPDERTKESPSSPLAYLEITYLTGKVMLEMSEDVDEKVQDVKKRIVEKMGLERLTEIDLLCDSVALPHTSTLAEAGLQPGQSCTLVGLLEQHWLLDDSKKGDGVVLLEGGVVKNTVRNACAYHPASCRVILGKSPLPRGRHRFRVRLIAGDYYYIGVAMEGVNLNTWLGNEKPPALGWSYYLRDDRSGSRIGPGYHDCGPRLRQGSSVTFCFDTVAGTLEYAQNDEKLKMAQTGLAGKDLYLALGMGPNDTTLKLEDAWREQ